MKQNTKYPCAFRFDNETIVVWLSPTKCFRISQLKLFDLS